MATVAELEKRFKKMGDAIAHSYIFFGHESAEEKITFAKKLANYFENKKWEINGRILLDAQILDARQEGGIDLVRSASRFLWQKPAVSSKRTLIVNNADDLTVPAQNAILKISEEPPAHALIMLLVKDPDVLLPAVTSRFQKIFFSKDSHLASRISHLGQEFLKAPAAKRKAVLGDLLDEVKESGDEGPLEDFIADLITELRRDKIKNQNTIKNLLARWALMKQFNLNKKLQLEAALVNI